MESPFYSDWKFWSFFVAALALLCSQLPPLRVLLRKGKLAVEVVSQVFLNHRYGNPNAQLHVIVSHLRGRRVRVNAITLDVISSSGVSLKLPAMSYIQKDASKGAILFTPFSLNAGEDWGHVVNFFPMLNRQDDRLIREATSAIQKDILAKRQHLDNEKMDVEAEPALVTPFIQLFERQFKWLPDEYTMTVRVTTDPPNAVADKKLRFILFDWDVARLKSTVDGYCYGASILYDAPLGEGVIVPFQPPL